jgi:SOS response regulatory protein OraA/RecX
MKKILLHYEFKNNEVRLYFEDETLSIHPNVYIKYQSELKQPIDLKTYYLLLDDHEYFSSLDQGLKYLKRPRTIHEMKDFLSRFTRNQIIDQVIYYLKAHYYLNDHKYMEQYIEAHPQYGPLMLIKKLKEKGIHTEVSSVFLHRYSFDDRLNNVLKKLLTTQKKRSYQALRDKMYQHGLSKGFDRHDIQAWISQHLKANDDDETIALHHFYTRTFEKIRTQINDNPCQKWTLKAVSKGFSYAQAKSLCEEKYNETMD